MNELNEKLFAEVEPNYANFSALILHIESFALYTPNIVDIKVLSTDFKKIKGLKEVIARKLENAKGFISAVSMKDFDSMVSELSVVGRQIESVRYLTKMTTLEFIYQHYKTLFSSDNMQKFSVDLSPEYREIFMNMKLRSINERLRDLNSTGPLYPIVAAGGGVDHHSSSVTLPKVKEVRQEFESFQTKLVLHHEEVLALKEEIS
jgi:hypothetical protein